MLTKKLIFLILTFVLFSIIHCFAVELTIHNPYQNITIILQREYDRTNKGKVYTHILTSKFSKNQNRLKLEEAQSVHFQIELKSAIGDNGDNITLPLQSYVAQNKDFTIEKILHEAFTLDNKLGEITYKIRIRGKNSKIKSFKIDILNALMNEVELTHRTEL